MLELQAFLAGEHPVGGVTATPGAGTCVPLTILGSSLYGAQLAGELGLPFGFASHFAPADLENAVALYRRTFRPSIFGKIATVIYMVTAVVAMVFNYLGYHSVLFDVLVWTSLAITLVSAVHYISHAARIIEAPNQAAAI